MIREYWSRMLRRRTNSYKGMATGILIAFTIFSCDDSRIYEDNVEFKDRSWKVMDEPRFEFSIRDTTLRYNLYYNVRNSLDYPFARIFVAYHVYDSTGRELSKKLVNHDLFDEKTGEPFGESGIGDLYDHQFTLLDHYHFPYPGKFSCKLDQFMRKDTLAGVVAVGIRVEKVPAGSKK